MAFSGNSQAEINVTPLIDVLLVLLIIFMVIVPTKPHGLKTQQPQGKPAEAAIPLPPIIVELFGDSKTPDVHYRVNTQEVAVADLTATLKPLMAARDERTLFVRADRDLTFSPVAGVVAAGKQAGAVTVSLDRLAKP